MTRKDKAFKNSKDKAQKAKQVVISTVTGLYKDQYKKKSGKWNISLIAEHTHLTRQTVAKYLNVWQTNQGGLFEEELGTIEGIKDSDEVPEILDLKKM